MKSNRERNKFRKCFLFRTTACPSPLNIEGTRMGLTNKALQRRVGVSEMNIEPRRHPLERSAGGMPHRGGCVSSGGKTKPFR